MRRDDKTVGQREKCEEKYQIAQMLQEPNRKTDSTTTTTAIATWIAVINRSRIFYMFCSLYFPVFSFLILLSLSLSGILCVSETLGVIQMSC